MNYPTRINEQRKESRVTLDLPAQIRIGSQLSLRGTLKNLSLKSAFITLRNSVYLQLHDEVGFSIQPSLLGAAEPIEGLGRISRIAAGEGLAIYFTRMDQHSTGRLRDLLKP